MKSLLKPQDRSTIKIIPTGVQDVPPSYFEDLQANDIFFMNSTHVVKTGSDVVYELFEIMPRLRHGVIVSFMIYSFRLNIPVNGLLKGIIPGMSFTLCGPF